MRPLYGLYLVTPDWDDTQKLLEVTEQAIQGGAAWVQYRHKSASPALRREQAGALLALCRRYERPFIINDFADLVQELDADGIHVGGTDQPVAAMRALLGPSKIVGASCYGSLAMAQAAHKAGASYVALGGFYPSRVKEYPVTTEPALIAQVKQKIPLPCVVIGGMTHQNCRQLIIQGADMVAAISSVYLADDPAAAAREIAALFEGSC